MVGSFEKGKGAEKFKGVFKELSISPEGFILRGNRIIIPENLVDQVIDLAHQGHLGIIKTKNLIRSKVSFPEIDHMVENKIKGFLACQACEPGSHRITPLEMSPMGSGLTHLGKRFR